jgi:uncharacterized membrane protein
MEAFYDYLARYPVLQLVVAILFILLFLFLLKKFFKMALITVLVIIMTLLGYYFVTSSGKLEDRAKSALDKTKQQTERVMDRGKSLIRSEADKISGDTGKLLDKKQSRDTERKRAMETLDRDYKPPPRKKDTGN